MLRWVFIIVGLAFLPVGMTQPAVIAVGYQIVLTTPPSDRYHVEGTKSLLAGRALILSHRGYEIAITLRDKRDLVEVEAEVIYVGEGAKKSVLHVAEREAWGETLEIFAETDGTELHAAFVAQRQ